MAMRISRRGLLLGAGATALLVAAYPVVRQVGTYPPVEGMTHLDAKGAAIWRVVGDFLAPPGGPLPGSGGDDVSLARIDALLGNVPEHTRTLLTALPWVFEHGTALDRYGARSLVHLPAERQRADLEAWAHSDEVIVAQLFMAARSVIGMADFERADVVAAMGIAPNCGGA